MGKAGPTAPQQETSVHPSDVGLFIPEWSAIVVASKMLAPTATVVTSSVFSSLLLRPMFIWLRFRLDLRPVPLSIGFRLRPKHAATERRLSLEKGPGAHKGHRVCPEWKTVNYFRHRLVASRPRPAMMLSQVEGSGTSDVEITTLLK